MIEHLLALILAIAPTYSITGYTPHDHCAPDDPGAKWCDGRTSSGSPADPALRVVAGPRAIACPVSDDVLWIHVPEIGAPFGDRVWIEGLGLYTIRDRGAAIVGRRLDVLVDTAAAAHGLTGHRRVVILGRRVES